VNTGQLLQNIDRSRSMGIITKEPVKTKERRQCRVS